MGCNSGRALILNAPETWIEATIMKGKDTHKLACCSLLAVLLAGSPAWADDDAEATIRLMGAAEATLPDAVMNEITLPGAARPNAAAVQRLEQALAHAGPGNRPQQSRADEALQNAKSASENARDNREDRGRSEDAPGHAEDRPGNGPPDGVPGRPTIFPDRRKTFRDGLMTFPDRPRTYPGAPTTSRARLKHRLVWIETDPS
jgi:hypothetical protein